MTEPADVLPMSAHLHAIAPGWPAPTGAPALAELTDSGLALDAARRVAAELEYPPAVWPTMRQPVGALYREDGMRSMLAWLAGLRERLRAGGAAETLQDFERLYTIVASAASTEMPLLRLYEYAAEAPEAVVTIVSARKEFVFWDTDMAEGSLDSLADMSPLWTAGAALAPESGLRDAIGSEPTAEAARACERGIRSDAGADGNGPLRLELDRLLAADARSVPVPGAATVIPTRGAILWRPRRLELVDVGRLHRWLGAHAVVSAGGALAEVASFVASAAAERADLLLDAFCTDSPEAL